MKTLHSNSPYYDVCSITYLRAFRKCPELYLYGIAEKNRTRQVFAGKNPPSLCQTVLQYPHIAATVFLDGTHFCSANTAERLAAKIIKNAFAVRLASAILFDYTV